MPVGMQSLRYTANGIPLRAFSPYITGCIIPVLFQLLAIDVPNTCSQPWEVQLPHLSVYFQIIGQLPYYDVTISYRPFPIGCNCDVMWGKHLPHISCKLIQFTSLLGDVHSEMLPTIPPLKSRIKSLIIPLFHSFLHSFSEGSRWFLVRV